MKVMLHHSIECKFQFLKGDSVILVFSYFRILKSVWIFPTVQFKIPPHKAELILTFLLLQRSPISSIWSSWPFWLWSHVCFSQVFEMCFPVVAVALLVWKKKFIIFFLNQKNIQFPVSIWRFRIQKPDADNKLSHLCNWWRGPHWFDSA